MEMGAKALYLRLFEFSIEKPEKYIYLFYFNVLNCSPQLSKKFKTIKEDPLQGNYFLVPVFHPSAARRLK